MSWSWNAIDDTEKLFSSIPQLHQCKLPTAQGPCQYYMQHTCSLIILNVFVRIKLEHYLLQMAIITNLWCFIYFFQVD